MNSILFLKKIAFAAAAVELQRAEQNKDD